MWTLALARPWLVSSLTPGSCYYHSHVWLLRANATPKYWTLYVYGRLRQLFPRALSYFHAQMQKIRLLWQLKTAIFMHSCVISMHKYRKLDSCASLWQPFSCTVVLFPCIDAKLSQLWQLKTALSMHSCLIPRHKSLTLDTYSSLRQPYSCLGVLFPCMNPEH